MSVEFGNRFSMCFRKVDSLFEGSVLRGHLNRHVGKAATPGAARSCCRRWRRLVRSQGRGGPRSQVLQGFLALLRVTVIAVGVGPLAEGLLDVRVPLRVSQTPLISGEEAKPSGGKERNERLPVDAHSTVIAIPGTRSSQCGREQIKSRDKRKNWGCGSKLF